MLPNRQGEIFFCSEETHGILECLPPFKGKIISALGGGYNKLYIIQDTIENEGIVSSLHPPEFDEYDTLFSQDLEKVEDPFEYITAFDNKGAFRQIRAGKKHLVVLTESGHLYSWGYGEFGALGLSGPIFSYIPQPIKPLRDRMVVQVACGEYHTLALTDKGDVYAWGRGFEGQLGIASSEVPTPPEYDLKERKKEEKLRKRAEMLKGGQTHFDESDEEEIHEAMKRTQAAITSKSQVPYYPVQTASAPRFIKSFFNNPIKYIACGAYFSFAINTRGELYGWGESRVGQLGVGRLLKVDLPLKIDVTAQPLTEEVKENSLIHTKITLKSDGLSNVKRKPESQPGSAHRDVDNNQEGLDEAADENPLVCFQSVSAGYGHTLALSEDGVIYTWGLNSKGQLGVGDKKTRYLPCRLRYDQLSNPLPKYKKIACGYYTSFAIDENGKLYSWGGGSLGHKDDKLQEMPRVVEAYTENRKFTDMFCTMKSSVFFAPMRVISIQPKSGPSSGGTMLTLLGTGFTETQQQRVKFVFKNYQREVECIYNAASEGLHCVTPKFNDIDDEEEIWPSEAEIYLALDGVNWVLAEEKFFIYSSNIQIISMNPKYASIQGGLSLTMDLNIDPVTISKIKIFTVGFQAKQLDLDDSRKNTSQGQQRAQAGGTPKQVKTRHRNTNSKEAINPLGITVTSADLDKEDWICVRGSYEKGKVTCEIPNVARLSDKLLYYNVDVSLNGQQFTGLPSSFRFYDLKVEKISPNNSPSMGDTRVIIEGHGFLDSEAKKLRFRSKFGERLVDITWIKDKKQYEFVVPPLSWLFGGNVPTPEEIEELKNDPPLIEITLNQLEWIPIGHFHYFDPDFDKISLAPPFETALSEEERKAKWQREEAEVDPLAGCKNDAERDKKQKELNKVAEQEEKEINEGFRKAGAPLYLRGKNFVKTDNIMARFVFENSGVVTNAVFKNPTKIGVIVPEMDELPPGINEVQVEISYNGQKFGAGKNPKKIKVMCFGKDMTAAERQAFETDLLKQKKGGKK